MKSDEEKKLKGTHRPDKAPVLNTSTALIKLPTAPKTLSVSAKKIWRVIGKKLINNGILTDLDLSMFERYCHFSGYLNDNIEKMLDPKLGPQEFYKYASVEKKLTEFENFFGLNPKSRKALGVGNKPKGKSKLMKLIQDKAIKAG